MVRIQNSEVKSQEKGLGPGYWVLGLLLLTCHSSLVAALAQQPQSSNAPVFSANAKYVQGVGPGYWPTAGTGLALNIAAGTAFCGNPPALVTYAGGTLTLTANATNYVFLDPVANCAPSANTSGFSPGQIPLAKAVAGASTITSVTDARTWFAPQPLTTDSTGGALGSLKKLNGIRFADQFPGANATAKLDAAIADLGSAPGAIIIPPGVGPGDATSYPNNAAILDFRQTYDVIGPFESDPDRPALLLIENRLGALTTKPVTGTVTLTNGSTTVTGVGTQFVAQFEGRLNRAIKLDSDPESAWGRVANVQSDTQMTLVSAFTGTGGTGAASYFITQLGLVINNVLEGGTPSEGHGEGVGLTSIGWRMGGTRAVFGANVNVGYYTRDPKAPAVGLELDLSNYSSADAVPGVNMEEALRMVSAGPKRVAAGIRMLKVAGGGEFVRGLWIGDSYSEHGIHVKGPSNHLYLIPNADNNSPMLVGRNAADSASQWVVNNDGSARFSTLAVEPSIGSFGANVQGYVDDSANSVAALNPNPNRTAAFLGASQNNSAFNQIGVWAVAASEHTSGTKPFVAGLEGDAYHESTGTVTILTGVAGYAEMSGGGTVSQLASLYAYENSRSSGTVTNNYGLYVDNQTAGTSNYSIYTAGTAPAQFGGPVISGLKAVSFSSTPTFDAKLGNTQKITLTGNVTSSTLSNATAGEQINFIICQDATGNRTFVWPSNVKGGMTIGSTASKCSAQTFILDGTNAYALSPGVSSM
jgi:hypothetical protein